MNTVKRAQVLVGNARTLDREVRGMACSVCESKIEPGDRYTWSIAEYNGDPTRPSKPSTPVHVTCA